MERPEAARAKEQRWLHKGKVAFEGFLLLLVPQVVGGWGQPSSSTAGSQHPQTRAISSTRRKTPTWNCLGWRSPGRSSSPAVTRPQGPQASATGTGRAPAGAGCHRPSQHHHNTQHRHIPPCPHPQFACSSLCPGSLPGPSSSQHAQPGAAAPPRTSPPPSLASLAVRLHHPPPSPAWGCCHSPNPALGTAGIPARLEELES